MCVIINNVSVADAFRLLDNVLTLREDSVKVSRCRLLPLERVAAH